MRLTEMFARAGVTPTLMSGEAEVTRATLDSRQATATTLFVARTGALTDGETYLDNPAGAVLAHSEEGFHRAAALGKAAALIPMPDRAETEWRLMDALYGHPTREMRVVGVTGTNGKTSVAWFLQSLLTRLGLRTAYLGTLGLRGPEESRELSNTTPYAVELYGHLAFLRDQGVEALAMEVSSHALAERRVDGVEFDAAVFTNLTQDHLDLHGTMADYEAAKRRLFTDLPTLSAKRFVAALNLGDDVGARWARDIPALTFTMGDGQADLKAFDMEVSATSLAMTVAHDEDSTRVEASVGGGYNAENALSAFAGAWALYEGGKILTGASPADTLRIIADAMREIPPVPGRFEPVPNDRGIAVIVDYAHTPDALTKLLQGVRSLVEGRVITVFGCGGDRDRTKRPLMARAASEGSDITVLTSDNPRTEDPCRILQDVRAGLDAEKPSVEIVDRREAIFHALSLAQPGDAVVIAGKGHEDYQIVGREKHPFDDRVVAREALG